MIQLLLSFKWVLIFLGAGLYQLQTEKVSNSQFGWKTKITDKYAFVSGPSYRTEHNGKIHACGAVFVYRKDNEGKFKFHQKIIPPDPSITRYFGSDIAVDNSDLIVGAPLKRYNTLDHAEKRNTGAVYAYYLNDNTNLWTLSNKIVSATITKEERFGSSVALKNGLGIIGTKSTENISIIRKDHSGKWVIINQIKSGYLGITGFSFNNNRLAFIGVPKSKTENVVVIMSIDNMGRFKNEKIISRRMGDHFYFADKGLCLFENICIVQSVKNPTNSHCPTQGFVYVYRINSEGSWIETDKSKSPNPSECDWFGRSIAISGKHVVVGAMGSNFNKSGQLIPYMGSAYLFRLNFKTGKLAFISSIDGPEKDWNKFGFSVDIYNGDIIIGSRLESYGNIKSAGGAYIYHMDI